jgi:hypothetical protein
MSIVRDRINRRTLTMDTDRAEPNTSGFEQLAMQRDYGAAEYYWHMRPPRRGQLYPMQANVHAMLHAGVVQRTETATPDRPSRAGTARTCAAGSSRPRSLPAAGTAEASDGWRRGGPRPRCRVTPPVRCCWAKS